MIPRGVHRKLSIWLLAYFDWFVRARIKSLLDTKHHQHKGASRQISHMGRKIVVALYIYVNIKLLINIYLQYRHDSDLLRLNRQLTGESAINFARLPQLIFANVSSSKDARAVELTTRLQESRRLLHLFGSPHANCCMITEPIYIVVIVMTYCVYFKFGPAMLESVQSHFPSILVDEKNEMIAARELAAHESRQLLSSSKNCVLNIIDKVLECELIIEKNRLVAGSNGPRTALLPACEEPPAGSDRQHYQLTDLQRQIAHHKSLVRQVNHLLDSGDLFPFNRFPEWVDKMSLEFTMYSIGQLIYALCQDLFLFSYLPELVGLNSTLISWTDYWLLIDIWIFVIISLSGTIYHVVFMSINTVDQTRYLIELESKYRLSICNIQSELNLIACRNSASRTEDVSALNQERSLEDVNLTVARAILQYKIFLAQYKSLRRSFSTISITCIAMIILLPTSMRFHLPYNGTKNIQAICFVTSLASIVICDSILVPQCIIHNKGQKIYRLLSQLLATMIELNQVLGEESRQACSGHNTSLMRRILSDPKEFTDQFATELQPEVHLTFGTLVEVHYWYSLIMISSFYQIESWRRLFGNRLNDPLGIFFD
jgi:hypothetical protein